MENVYLNKKVAYIYSLELEKECNKLPTMRNRASFVQDLLCSYDLLKNPNVIIVRNAEATDDELKLFHSSFYIEFLKKVNADELEKYEDELEEYGLAYDCPLLENNYAFVKAIAGASISAAKLLISERCKFAINWFGGWHHAQRDFVEGFCYVNDIVLAIHMLQKKFLRILYVDLDIHHGNGVQNAFEFSDKVFTLSFHKCAPGFYPGTGLLQEIGSQKGKYYTVNVPFLQGISDDSFSKLFHSIYDKVFSCFKPDAIVVQCGADGLIGDPIGECNLTLEGIGKCVSKIVDCDLPTIFLGGGGYNFPNVARLWTYLTSLILKEKIDNNIPDSCSFYTNYTPTYELHIDKGNRKDYNSDDYITKLVDVIHSNCNNLPNFL